MSDDEETEDGDPGESDSVLVTSRRSPVAVDFGDEEVT